MQIEDVTNAFNKNKDDSGLLPVAELGTALRMLGHVLDKEGLITARSYNLNLSRKKVSRNEKLPFVIMHTQSVH